MSSLLKADLFVAILGVYLFYILITSVLNRMSREVPQPLRCAIAILIVPGVAGKVMGAAMGSWEVYVDILLLGGLALLFTVDRRHQASEELEPKRLVARTCAVIAFVAIGLGCSAVHAQAEAARESPRVVQVSTVRACQVLASWVQAIGDYRDAGASLEGLLPIIRKRNLEQPPETLALMVRETKRVYEKAHMGADELGADAFDRCAFGLVRTQ